MSTPTVNPMALPGTWDRVAEAYEAYITPTFLPFAADALRLAAPRRDATILDVAAGPGTLSLLAAPRVARVHALDFAPAMVARLQAAAASSGLTNVSAEQGDACALPYADAAFDAAFCMFGLMFVPDRARALIELRRVLRPGGRLVVTTWPPMARMPLFHEVMGVLRRHVPGLPPDDGRAPLGELDELSDALAAAGFRDITVSHAAHVLPYTGDPVGTWEVMTRSNAPVAMMREALPAELWARISEDVVAMLTERFVGAVDLPLVANLGVGS
ncbi:MAG: class I SAM-dependent methyltransferase [Myxococcota bacterium]